MTTTSKGLKLGTTLYSLTSEFHGRDYSFEQLIRKVAAENLGPGLEIVGFQSIRGFPEVTDAFADQFKGLMAETGLTATCLGVNADLRIDPDRPMSEDESVAYHARQIEAAAKLGFPVVRYQYPAGANVIRKLVPTAEKLGVKMGLEVHAPHHASHPDIIAYREMYAEVDSPFVGFIPDFGATLRTIPPSFLEAMVKEGVPLDLIELAKKHWHSDLGEPYARRDAYLKEAREKGFDERLISELIISFGLFARAQPESWLEIMPQVVHIHGKFYDFDQNGDEVAIDYGRILPLFVNAGYDGYMSSEYEGHMYNNDDGFDKLRRHHALARRILGSLEADAQ